MTKCEEINAEKKNLGQALLYSKPKIGVSMLLYLTVTIEVISSVLITEEDGHQLPITI